MQYQNSFDNIHTSTNFRSRMVVMIEKMNNRGETPISTSMRTRIPFRRKALLIAIAAILFLLSACAAYAVYWSSTQRAKEYSQSESAVDDRRVLAERSADEIIAGMTFYSPINGTAEVDGITFTLKGVNYWLNDDPPELHLVFSADDKKTGDMSRLYNFDYTLNIGDKSYPAYANIGSNAQTIPAIATADALDAQYEIWFRMGDQVVADGTAMTLAGSLYSYAADGQRGDCLGNFSLGFTYTIPKDQIEAERARLVEQILNDKNTEAKVQAAELAEIPDEMTQLNITQDEYTFTDAQVTEDGFILGQTRVTDGADAAEFYMDGYHCYSEVISHIFTPDTTRPQLHLQPWEAIQYFGTYESVFEYPWYAPLNEMPETVLVAVLRNQGSHKMARGGDENDPITYSWNEVALLLRVNPHTGEITLPKDEAERNAWREETEKLASDGRNEPSYCLLDSSEKIGDVSLTLERLGFNPTWRELYVSYRIDGLYCPPETSSSLPRIYLNGVELEGRNKGGQYTTTAAKQWVESYGTFAKVEDWQSSTSGHAILVTPEYLPDSFNIRFVWDVYDRDEAYNRVFIGTFDITFQVDKHDIQIGEAVL